MSALSQLTAVQADAVVATGGLCLRDPEDLAVDLFPLLHINPFAESREASEIPYMMANTREEFERVRDLAWPSVAISDALTTEIPVVESTVNETLTPGPCAHAGTHLPTGDSK